LSDNIARKIGFFFLVALFRRAHEEHNQDFQALEAYAKRILTAELVSAAEMTC